MSGLRQFEGLAAAIKHLQRTRGRGPSREADLVADAVIHTARRVVPRFAVDEVVSDAFLKVRNSNSPLQGDTDRSAHAYLRRAVSNAFIDCTRREGRRKRRLSTARGDDGLDPLDHIAAPEPDPKLSDRALARLEATKDRLRGHLDAYLEEAHFKPKDQELRFHQAHCCLMSVLEKKSAAQIREALGLSVSNEVLYKWTERGRPLLLGTLERWDGDDLNTDNARAIGFLRALFQARRADAGQARAPRPKRVGKAAKKPKKSAKTAKSRARSGQSVSPRDTGASVQYMPHKTRRPGKKPGHGGAP